MKLLIFTIIIGSTISVDCYDFKKDRTSYSTQIIHSNPQYPDQEAQSAYEVHFGSSPHLTQQQKPSVQQFYENQNQYLQPSQAFNVGYSVSFTNGAPSKPKQTYPDIVLGSHKEQVVKPNYATNYMTNQLTAIEVKPNRATWQNLGSGKEMFQSNTMNLDTTPNTVEYASSSPLYFEDGNQPRSFDHAKALGGSQGFDYTDVLGVNPILQFNQKYNQEIPDVLQATFNYPPTKSVSMSTSSPIQDNVISLGNHPGTNIVISDNLEAKVVPLEFTGLKKQTDPNHEMVETFTANPTTYEDLSGKFKLSKPLPPLRFYQTPTSDLMPSQSQYSQYYAKREVQRPDFSYGFVPQSSNQHFKNYRTLETVYDLPHRYYSKNLDGGRMKKINVKTKFARGIKTSMQPPKHRTLPRRKWLHNTRLMN